MVCKNMNCVISSAEQDTLRRPVQHERINFIFLGILVFSSSYVLGNSEYCLLEAWEME